MIPNTTSRTCDYSIQRGHFQLQLSQPRINLAIMGVDVSFFFFLHFERRNRKAQFIDIHYFILFI
jgi:hypothetical protein